MKLYAPDIVLINDGWNNDIIIANPDNSFFPFRYYIVGVGKIKETTIGDRTS